MKVNANVNVRSGNTKTRMVGAAEVQSKNSSSNTQFLNVQSTQLPSLIKMRPAFKKYYFLARYIDVDILHGRQKNGIRKLTCP